MLFGVGVSCRILYSIFSYFYVSCSGSITSVGAERTNLSTIVYLYLCGFCSERFPLGAWDGLRYFIVALPRHSIYIFPANGRRNKLQLHHLKYEKIKQSV